MILLLETVHEDAHEILSGVGPVEVVPDLHTFDPSSFAGIRAILTRGLGQVTEELMASFPDLAVVARCGAGLDNVDIDAAARAGVMVIHAPGLTTAAVAEQAVLLMLAVGRRLVVVDEAVKSGNWDVRDGFTSTEMNGKRLGIIGYGAIGSRIAEIGAALGMDVVCTTRRTEGVDVPRLELEVLLRTADVVQICVPLTPVTESMLGPEQFALMRPSAIVINTARGSIVDQEALANALEEGRVAGYGADVWDPEPPRPGDRVLAHPATVVTPHVAGLTDVTYREICVRPARAVVQVLNGNAPDPNCVSRAYLDRMAPE
jgi:D-3-phosphoglycerate dehydrogenase